MTLDDKIFHTNEIANAIQRHQEFYTLKVGDKAYSIMLPTPQTCGTMTQQRTYAMDKAQEILNQFAK
jgi:hypothetical protein